MSVSISIIIPTLGRPSLKATLESMLGQLAPGDELLVVGDGPQPEARRMAEAAGARYLQTFPTRLWGHAQRNLGMAEARGEYLSFMDDDDLYLPGALDSMRRAAGLEPGRPFIFRMMHLKRPIWVEPEISLGNVSTQMYFFPNRKDKLATWGPNPDRHDGRWGDFTFAKDVQALWRPDPILFRTERIARIPAHSDGGLHEAPEQPVEIRKPVRREYRWGSARRRG